MGYLKVEASTDGGATYETAWQRDLKQQTASGSPWFFATFHFEDVINNTAAEEVLHPFLFVFLFEHISHRLPVCVHHFIFFLPTFSVIFTKRVSIVMWTKIFCSRLCFIFTLHAYCRAQINSMRFVGYGFNAQSDIAIDNFVVIHW